MAQLTTTDDVRAAAESAVLCWLASCDVQGQPNVSPKEVFAVFDEQHLVIANIASPQSARNIRVNPKVSLGFVDVFTQKGYKINGKAREILKREDAFVHWAEPLLAMVGDRFTLHSVFVVAVESIAPILAPSYLFYPDTTEAAQVAAALKTYRVHRDT